MTLCTIRLQLPVLSAKSPRLRGIAELPIDLEEDKAGSGCSGTWSGDDVAHTSRFNGIAHVSEGMEQCRRQRTSLRAGRRERTGQEAPSADGHENERFTTIEKSFGAASRIAHASDPRR
jgi:hypothetical protein